MVLGVLFVRLGLWQLDRRGERRAINDRVHAQLSRTPVSLIDLGADTDAVGRRATLTGTPDFAHEIIVAGRSRNGSPGVHILTPFRLPGRDTAVLVNRGWVYSPDAASVDLDRWREPRSGFSGFTQRLPEAGPGGSSANRRTVRQLTHAGVQRHLPYPVKALYLVAQDSVSGDGTPVRLEPPVLSDGPHLSYAIQWFAFAAIALIGAGAVVWRARRDARNGAQLAGERGQTRVS